MKFLVLETYESFSIVLSEDGKFLTVANLGYEVGQKVTNVYEIQTDSTLNIGTKNIIEFSNKEIANNKIKNLSERNKTNKLLYLFGVMAACFAIFLGINYQIANSFAGTVYMSINPKIKIDVNKADKVMNLEALNSDGKNLISEYQYKNKKLENVIDELLDKSITIGYLKKNGKINIKVQSDLKWKKDKEEKLDIHLKNYLKNKLNIKIKIDDDLDENQNESPKINLPINKNNIIETKKENPIKSNHEIKIKNKPINNDNDLDDDDDDDNDDDDSVDDNSNDRDSNNDDSDDNSDDDNSDDDDSDDKDSDDKDSDDD